MRVTMLNINQGHNEELMHNCEPLTEYAWFVAKVREYFKRDATLEKAIDRVIDEMPGSMQIRPYLAQNRAEVKKMWLHEYDEDEARAGWRRDGLEEGRAQTQRDIFALINRLSELGRQDDLVRATQDPAYYEQLIEEFGIR